MTPPTLTELPRTLEPVTADPLVQRWSGIHFLTPDQQRVEMGQDIARYCERRYFHATHGGDPDDR